jgi:large subunit ribosomal protein L6
MEVWKMSRIGKLPINLPAGVKVDIAQDNTVTVHGPKGVLSQQVNRDITVKQEGEQLILTRPTDNKPHKSMHGLYRSLVNNMVVGVTDGFAKTLEMVGTGYRAAAQGTTLTINIGFSHPVVLQAPANISFETPVPTRIVVRGIDKQQVGNLAADIRAIRKPEPYLGKGIKYEGEVIRRKEGKTGKK